jgi:hypothetical protein
MGQGHYAGGGDASVQAVQGASIWVRNLWRRRVACGRGRNPWRRPVAGRRDGSWT